MPDVSRLLAYCKQAGFDLRPHFRADLFVREAVKDIMQWLDVHTGLKDKENWRASDRHAAARLQQAGLGTLAERVLKEVEQGASRDT